MKNRTICLSLSLALVLSQLACVPSQRPMLRSLRTVKVARQMQVGDMVEIHFWHYPNLNQNLTVESEGNIIIGLGNTKLAGKTPEDLKLLLRKYYLEKLAAPDIEIRVVSSIDLTVYFGGELKNPGLYPFEPNMSIARGLLQAGGFVGRPEEYEIHIFRHEPGHSVQKLRISLSDKAQSGKIITVIKLAPNDVVYVLKTALPVGRRVI